MKAIQHLCRLANQRRLELHRHVPASCIPQSKYTDQDSKSLTQCIVDWFILNHHFVIHLSSTLTRRTDIQRYAGLPQRTELPTLFAVVDGRAVFVEVNTQETRLTHIQSRTFTDLEYAGAYVYVASTFQDFYDWFNTEFVIPPFEYDTTK